MKSLDISALFYFFVGCISFQLHIHKMIIFTHLFLSFFVCECRFISRVSRFHSHKSQAQCLDKNILMRSTLQMWSCSIFTQSQNLGDLCSSPPAPTHVNVNSTRRLMQSFTCKVLWKCHHQRSFEQTRALAYQVKPRYKI